METAATQISTEQIIAAVGQLSLPELDKVFDTVLTARAERLAPTPASVEEPLISRAKQGPPAEFQVRFNALKAKRADGTINDAEYAELTQLADQAEILHAERLAAIGELARLRGRRLPEMIAELGLHFPENG